MGVKVNFNVSKVFGSKQQLIKKAQVALDTQIIKDTEPYVPFKEGELKNSVQKASKIGKGILIYDTLYAKKLYYGDNYKFRKDRHPLASSRWFERAKASKKAIWIQLAKKAGGFK